MTPTVWRSDFEISRALTKLHTGQQANVLGVIDVNVTEQTSRPSAL